MSGKPYTTYGTLSAPNSNGTGSPSSLLRFYLRGAAGPAKIPVTVPTSGMSSLLAQYLSGTVGPAGIPLPPCYQWVFVTRRFTTLLNQISITPTQRDDGETKQTAVRACLNRWYWSCDFETANSLLIGSWGKNTRLRPSRDIDILFLLPSEVYWRFQSRNENRQSQLLQEVRYVLGQTYSQTALRGDGQVVSVPFSSMPVEVVPGFRCTDGTIIICDTNDGGRYKKSSAEAEAYELDASDRSWNGNTRALARMLKQWQRERNVPLKSFQLERLAVEFLRVWPFRHRDVFWYDWMVRDFLAYLISRANGYLFMPGTGECVALGNEWLSRAITAHSYARQACDYERENYEALAGYEWRQIFGEPVPVLVS
jgi:Second Messenger Oligonucleotide or Dinucleotide Synthetase domain